MSTANRDHTPNQEFPKSPISNSTRAEEIALLEHQMHIVSLLNTPDLLAAMIDSLAYWAKEWLALQDQDPLPANYHSRDNYLLFDQMLPLLNACNHLRHIINSDAGEKA